MLKKLLFYLHGFQRYDFYNVILLGSAISRKTLAKFIDINIIPWQCSVFNLKFLGTTKAKRRNEAHFSKLNA